MSAEGASTETPVRKPAVVVAPMPALGLVVIAVVVLLAAAFPLLTANLYLLSIATTICIYAALAQCWNLTMGVAGIWSFAQVALFAVGAYTNVLLIVKLSVPSGAALLAGGFGALVVGIAIGLPAVRLRGVYVVLFTLAFHEIMRILIATDDSGFTGGTFGLYGFDAFGLRAMDQGATARGFYYLSLALLVFVCFIVYRILRSPLGLAFRSMRDSETYAVARGVNRTKYQVIVFAVTAFLSGLAGAVYSDYVGTAAPSILSFELMSLLLAMIVIGGWGTFAGPVIGALIVMGLSERLRDVNEFRLLTLGTIMAAMIIYLPGGIVGLVSRGRGALDGFQQRLDRWLAD